MNITLPKGAVMVKQRIEKYESKSSLILDDTKELDKVYDDGEIVYAAPELQDMIGKKIKFRVNFAEFLPFQNEDLLYFRDLESSMFYIINE